MSLPRDLHDSFVSIFSHSENHFHILSLAPTSNPPLHISVTGGGDEVVTLTRLELHLLRRRRKRPECDGEVHEVSGLITDCNDPWLGVDDSAGVELLLLYTVYDVSLSAVTPTWADDVHLVIFPRVGVFIDLNDVVVVSPVTSTKDWVGDVPVDRDGLRSSDSTNH